MHIEFPSSITYDVRMLEGEYVSPKIDVHCFLFDIDDVHILNCSKYVVGFTRCFACSRVFNWSLIEVVRGRRIDF